MLGHLPGLVVDLSNSLVGAALLSLGLGNGNAALDLLGHELEGFVDVLAVFGGGLKESHIIVLRKFSSFIGANLALRLHVALVAYQDP